MSRPNFFNQSVPRAILAVILVMLAGGEGKALAEESPQRGYRFLPDHLDYRHYIADPKRPRIGASVLNGDEGEVNYDTAIGGAFALLDLPSGPPPFERLQVAGFAGVFSRFDYNEHYDEIGSDYRAGLSISAVHDPWAVRLQYFHESDHLGDEYILRERDVGDQRHGFLPRMRLRRGGVLAVDRVSAVCGVRALDEASMAGADWISHALKGIWQVVCRLLDGP